MAKITTELKDFVKASPHIKKLYFTADGSYSLNAYKCDGKMYTKLIDKSLAPSESEMKKNEVVVTLSRVQILGQVRKDENETGDSVAVE